MGGNNRAHVHHRCYGSLPQDILHKLAIAQKAMNSFPIA